MFDFVNKIKEAVGGATDLNLDSLTEKLSPDFLKSLPTEQVTGLLDQVKSLDLDSAKEKLSSLIPNLPIDSSSISSLLEEVKGAMDTGVIATIIDKIKSFFA